MTHDSLGRLVRAAGLRSDSQTYMSLRRNYHRLRALRAAKTYSQFGEDAILRSIFGGIRFGQYIDVGAGDPVRGSNTYGLYRARWGGVLIDPLGFNIAGARRWRPRDTAIQALVGAKETIDTFYEYDPYEYSTNRSATVERWAALGIHPIRKYPLKTITLSSLGRSMDPSSPSLISIDVEGNEEAVLRGNDWLSTKPAVICVEEWGGLRPGSPILYSILEPQGYEFAAFSGMSSVYIHGDSPFRF